jgi:hypothetical protein
LPGAKMKTVSDCSIRSAFSCASLLIVEFVDL